MPSINGTVILQEAALGQVRILKPDQAAIHLYLASRPLDLDVTSKKVIHETIVHTHTESK